jgi:hypothetical protein
MDKPRDERPELLIIPVDLERHPAKMIQEVLDIQKSQVPVTVVPSRPKKPRYDA